MTDIALQPLDEGRSFATVLYAGDLIRDDSLRTAVVVSLFTDREATPEQLVAAGLDPTDRRGCWADGLSAEGDRAGSHLWLLDRRKRRSEMLPEARRYAEQALAWLIADGLASEVAVTASFGEQGELRLDVDLFRPTGREQYRLGLLWAANFAKSAVAAAEDDAAESARTAADIERIWFVEYPEITA